MTAPGTAPRIDAVFARLRREGRKAYVAYAVAGDPDPESSLAVLRALVDGGVDILELGYPFSDPILDGATIQRANRRAVSAAGNLAATLDLVAAFRRTDRHTPIILMGYANPLAAMGYAAFAGRAAAAGVDGVIVADMPLRESDDFLRALDGNGLCMVPLAAPNLEEKDFALKPGVGGFLYCIPVIGPTGGPSASAEAIRAAVARCRGATPLPVLVGFGIKTPDAAAEVAGIADGVIVGSVLVESASAMPADPGGFGRLVAGFRAAIDAASGTG